MSIIAVAEVEVGRPAEVVFGEVAAVERYPMWLRASGVVAVERDGEGPLVSGSRFFVTQRVAGNEARLDAVVTVAEEPTQFAFRATEPRGITLHVEVGIVPLDLRSRVRWTARIDLPFRLRLFEGIARAEVVRATVADLEGLRRMLDATADAP